MLIELSLAYLRERPLITALNTLLLALGVGVIVLLLLVSERLEQRLTRDAAGIDLVIGAKGSPLQLILSSVYHVDIPTGNIPFEEVERWRHHDLVEAVIPLALGDSLGSFRIVGSEPAYPEHYGAEFAEGRYWQAPLEAVLGASVAAKTGLAVGDRFAGNHGLAPGGPAHADHPYTVVGILTPTGSIIDRLVLTGIDSIWRSHGLIDDIGDGDDGHGDAGPDVDHHEEDTAAEASSGKSTLSPPAVTALLVTYRTPLAAVQLPPLVNRTPGLQAAAPAWEMARLLALIGVGVNTLRGFGLVLMAAAALSLFVALTTALQARRHDLAVMRTLGASPGTLWRQLLLEGALLAALGTVLGVLLGHVAAGLLALVSPDAEALGLRSLHIRVEELYVVALALLTGLAAAMIPALQAYRTDIVRLLASGR
ncbi:MAG: FtsX-like permease family protein [Alphaproteobacteria bacterium]